MVPGPVPWPCQSRVLRVFWRLAFRVFLVGCFVVSQEITGGSEEVIVKWGEVMTKHLPEEEIAGVTLCFAQVKV